MQQTSHFQLSQWEGEDRILRENFNSDNAKVDAALADHAAALAGCGNCRLWATTYVGTDECGPSHPNHLTFPNGMPLAALVFSYCGEIMVLVPNATSTPIWIPPTATTGCKCPGPGIPSPGTAIRPKNPLIR